jgi:NTP pyrophosphatase (non-canonical NTP hydrolase)
MLSRLHVHITRILKAVRKENYITVDYDICSAFSWSLALADRFHFDLADEMWKRYPGFCPYCLSAPCACKERRKNRQRFAGKFKGKRPVVIQEWQKMFWSIYPNALQNSAIHLAEEAGEVDEALRNYIATHEKDWFIKVVEELVDLVTNIFAVASCLHIDLAVSLVAYFAKGCPACKTNPCKCGYVAVDHPIPLRRIS